MFKRFLAAMAALMLAVAIFGAATATPAQADIEPQRTGSTAWFNNIDDTPKSYDLRVTKVSGSTFLLSWQERLSNVESVCPKPESPQRHYIVYRNPLGNQGTLPVGECLYPIYQGVYDVGVGHI